MQIAARLRAHYDNDPEAGTSTAAASYSKQDRSMGERVDCEGPAEQRWNGLVSSRREPNPGRSITQKIRSSQGIFGTRGVLAVAADEIRLSRLLVGWSDGQPIGNNGDEGSTGWIWWGREANVVAGRGGPGEKSTALSLRPGLKPFFWRLDRHD